MTPEKGCLCFQPRPGGLRRPGSEVGMRPVWALLSTVQALQALTEPPSSWDSASVTRAVCSGNRGFLELG